MKKLLITFFAAAILLSSANAYAGGGHRSGNDWVGPVIFGTVLGVIIANGVSNNHGHVTYSRPRHHRHHSRRFVRVCNWVEHIEWDRYGSYVVRNLECHMVPSR
jgi:hypothetical protein